MQRLIRASPKKATFINRTSLSSKPPSDRSKGSILPFIVAISAPGVALAGLAYKLEEDENFARTVENRIPDIKSQLKPVTSILISSGIVKAKPSHTTHPVIVELPPVVEYSPQPSVDIEEEISPTQTEFVEDTPDETAETAVPESETEEAAIETVEEEAPPTPAVVIDSNEATQAIEKAEEQCPELTLPQVTSEIRSKRIFSDSTNQALNEQTNQSVALRNEIESTLLRDLHLLDEHALRIRVTQLAAELFERTKWEGVRLHQSLKQVEADLTHRYSDLMVQQRAELELELNKRLVAKEQLVLEEAAKKTEGVLVDHQVKLSHALHLQGEKHNALLTTELKKQEEKLRAEHEDQRNHELALVRERHVKERIAMQDQLEVVAAQLMAYESSLKEIGDVKTTSKNAHKQSAAVLALESALTTSKPLAAELAALKASAGDDVVVSSVLASIPATAATKGVPTVLELKSRFSVLRDELRKVALAPPNSYLVNDLTGYVIGSVLASVSKAPSGYVAGDGLEERLARTAYYLDLGRIEESFTELDALEGYSRNISADFLQLLQDRMVVNQAAKVLRANAILTHSSLP